MNRGTIRQHAMLIAWVALFSLWGVSLYFDRVDAQSVEWHKSRPKQHKSKWKVHDLDRPLPKVVTPGANASEPPADAIVLFDGKDLSEWVGRRNKPAGWKVVDGHFEVNKTGDIRTKRKFRDCQMHIEFRMPNPPKLKSQARGNSGIWFMNRYELQILDSSDNPTYADGSCGSVYGQHPPLFNASRTPGEWQTYDIIFRAPRFGKDKKLLEPARFTVFHNGVAVQHHAEVFGGTTWGNVAKYRFHEGPDSIRLQDHGDGQNPAFRNVWIRELNLDPTD